MGAFDDLISPQAPRQSRGDGAFDDLISSPHNGPSRIEAFGYNAADGATFGFGDEAAGAIAGAGAVLGGGDYALAYRQRVDAARQRLQAAREAHPISSLAGTLVGATGTFLIPGGVAATGSRLGLGGLEAAGRAGQAVVQGQRLMPFGSAIGRMAAGGGSGAVLAQSLRGAQTGALFGGIYGIGSGDGDVGERLQAGGSSALMGAGFGLVSPLAFQGLSHSGQWYSPLLRGALGAGAGAVSSLFTGADPVQSAAIGAGAGVAARPILGMAGPLLSSVRRAWTNPRAAFGNQTGMSIGVPPIGDDAAAAANAGPEPNPNAVRRVTDALHRQRTSIDTLESQRQAAVAEAAVDRAAGRNPIDRRLADTGDELSAELDTLSNMPGQSYTRVRELAQERSSALPRELRSEMRGILGVRETPGELIDDLRTQAANASDGYETVLSRPIMQDVVEQRIAPLMQAPEMQPVLARRFRVEDGAEQLARIRGEPAPPRSVVRTENGYELSPNVTGRQLHELKVSIDDELNAAIDRRSLSPAGRGEQQMLDDYRNAYIGAMDDAVPGYAVTRSQRGSVFDAERALRLDANGNSQVGKQILKMDPEEISRFMREITTSTGRRRSTTPFERNVYRTGVVHEILQRIDDYVSAASDKTRNAGEVLDRVGLQNRLRAVFGDRPSEINRFLDRAIERAEALRRAGSWTGNSSSMRRFARASDQLVDSMANAGASLATGNPMGAAAAVGRGTYNALVLRNLENQNNAYGNALLARLGDDPETLALFRAIRKLQADRSRRALEAGAQGSVGAVGGGGHADDTGGGYY